MTMKIQVMCIVVPPILIPFNENQAQERIFGLSIWSDNFKYMKGHSLAKSIWHVNMINQNMWTKNVALGSWVLLFHKIWTS